MKNGVYMNVNTACLRYTSIGVKARYWGLQVCAILDDSSRMIIAGREFVHCNTENSIEVIDELVREYWDICPLRELMLDHGREFGAHRINKEGSLDSKFKIHIKALGIKPKLAAVRHPQTNGKVEKWFHAYKTRWDSLIIFPQVRRVGKDISFS